MHRSVEISEPRENAINEIRRPEENEKPKKAFYQPIDQDCEQLDEDDNDQEKLIEPKAKSDNVETKLHQPSQSSPALYTQESARTQTTSSKKLIDYS